MMTLGAFWSSLKQLLRFGGVSEGLWVVLGVSRAVLERSQAVMKTILEGIVRLHVRHGVLGAKTQLFTGECACARA